MRATLCIEAIASHRDAAVVMCGITDITIQTEVRHFQGLLVDLLVTGRASKKRLSV